MKKIIKFSDREEEMTFEEVAVQFEALINKEAYRYRKVLNPYGEDLKQIALVGLWKAFGTYNGSVNFLTFAMLCIKSEFNKCFRRNYKFTRENNYIKAMRSLDELINFSEGKDTERYELLGEIDEDIEVAPERLFIKKFKSDLNDNELKIMDYILYKNFSQKELAEELGIAQTNVSRRVKKLLTRIKEEYVGGDW